MKKFILTILFGIMMAISAIAQDQIKPQEQTKPKYEVIYTEDYVDDTKVYQALYFIDRAGKKILNFDPEDPYVIESPEDYIPGDIKSSKKEGNTETITFKQGQDPYEYKIVFTINPKLTNKDDLSSQTMKSYVQGQAVDHVYKIYNYDQLPDEEKENIEATRKWREQEAARKAGKATAGSGANKPADVKATEPQAPEQKVKEGVKNILDKGKNLIKKK
ncbi:MAG: hypothetical protein IKY25_02850 [Alistipes sp.]|nr:hypothetical protein [Alistipes sp.]